MSRDIFYKNSINAGLIGDKSIRLVLHKDISSDDIDDISNRLLHSSSEF